MSHLSVRRIAAVACSAAVVSTAGLALPAQADVLTSMAFGGSAYGSTAKVGTVSSGQSALSALCTTNPQQTAHNDTAKVTLAGIGTVGAVTTQVSSVKETSSVSSVTTTRTGASNLLNGLVTASAISTVSTASHSATGFTTRGASSFVGLRIAGTAITANPGQDKTVNIAQVGSVVLNHQQTSTSYGNHAITVTGLRLNLLSGNKLGLPAGTIVIGSGTASLHNPTHNRPYGSAYGTQVAVGDVVRSGATAAVFQSCGGTDGATRTNQIASVSVPSVLTTAAVQSSTQSTDSATSTVVVSQSRLTGVKLLGGVVTMDAVTAKITVTRRGAIVTSSTTGTAVTGLKVNGKSLAVNTAENTAVNLSGVGTLTLRQTARSSNGIQVYAVQLRLTTARAGLPVGATLTVGSASGGSTYH